MKERVKDKGRNFVVITDPHIKHNFEYDVFIEGMINQASSDKELKIITPSSYDGIVNDFLVSRYRDQ